MSDRPDWATDGAQWPNRVASRFVSAAGLNWHVQVAGRMDAPVLLLLHGTGAATHSWAGLLPLLGQHYRVIAPDLPGHGFTGQPPDSGMSLPAVATAVAGLLSELGEQPRVCVGHSAGAAIGARMALDGLARPDTLFSLNGALLPMQNMPMHLFSPLARLLSANKLVVRLFAWHAADRTVVARLLRGTGSEVPPESLECYARLMRRSGHAAGALAMMSRWDLRALQRDLPQLPVPMVMINGGNDRTIPPGEAARVQALLPAARLITLPALGHLAHEEAPRRVAQIIVQEVLPQQDAA